MIRHKNLAIWVLLLSTSGICQAQKKQAPIQADVVYGHKDGLAMTMDVFRPQNKGKGDGAGIMFMVSGGWFSTWVPPQRMVPFFRPYLQKGFTVFAVRHGSSPRYSIPDAVSDVRRAVRFTRLNAKKFGVDPTRIGVTGMSAGGHLSLMLGTTGDNGKQGSADPVERTPSRVAAVVAFVPPTDLRVAVWESPKSLPAYRNFPALNLPLKKAGAYSPLVQVSKDDAPSLVIMGGADKLVPADHGKWIADAYKKVGVKHKLVIYPKANHGLGGSFKTAMTESVKWFETYLVAKKK